eukprot:CAMPEP_0113462960 /NCGR_PEP_ID=MMETSP0014_2-20120614/12386_1 /TAXON_ID=2857 /ORGANISM="Nitzschia sp." /LENGTH=287 /DNA_ID=CAMNT_0000354889 /DNA_START=181 /DNA_END=1044 /DNA_ORIENTATION=- /assembly_acc=CAM_ASM_000159
MASRNCLSRVFTATAAAFLVAAAAGSSSHSDGSGVAAAAIIELTDETFEHQTQASTGMTTGSWFVFFFENSQQKECGPPCRQISSTLAKLTTDNAPEEAGEDPTSSTSSSSLADQGIIFASVDCEASPVTCTRFNILPPALLYFHKKAMYPYPGGSSSSVGDGGGSDSDTGEEQEFFNTDNISEELVRKFVMEDFKLLEGMEIPPPPSPLDDILSQLVELYEVALQPENQLLSIGIGGMAVMLLGTVLVLIKTLLSSSSSSSSSSSPSSKSNDNSTKTTKKKKTKKS